MMEAKSERVFLRRCSTLLSRGPSRLVANLKTLRGSVGLCRGSPPTRRRQSPQMLRLGWTDYINRNGKYTMTDPYRGDKPTPQNWTALSNAR